jgi:histidyl-tRNA synthetase
MKPTIPKGTRDFLPDEMAKRNYIFNTIKEVFRLYGFSQIETPAMENLSTLMGKYGEEGDKLLFKILNSGDYLANVPADELVAKESNKLVNKLSEKGLRYDLTVPFARFVVQYRDKITFPFKRYQIQPVWRADRPQKGRYREFFQCDADIVGSDSLVNEVELIQLIDTVFTRLNLHVLIKLNNRKILSGIAELIGEPDKIVDITVAIDKYEKIGLENVQKELLEKGLTQQAIDTITPIITLSGDNPSKLATLKKVLANTPIGIEGINELEIVLQYIAQTSVQTAIEVDLTLARGLNYYTGAIIEVKSLDVQIGSITGGGRYDNLTGVFGMQGVSGVGISFGADRIYDVLNQLELYPQNQIEKTCVLVLPFGESERLYSFQIVNELRTKGIATELYPDLVKLKKQLAYADAKGIPYVLLIGENEIQTQTLTLKNMLTGEQYTGDKDTVFAKIL